MLESRLSAEQDRISALEESVVDAKQDATNSEQLLVEVSQSRHVPHSLVSRPVWAGSGGVMRP